LHVHRFGQEGGPRLVCLHGVTSWGGHFRKLAERLAGWEVLAPDLLGHGSSRREPPWSVEDQVEAVLQSCGGGQAAWLGHSYGGRVAFEVAARAPEAVERLVLLDPAIQLLPHVGLYAAEQARLDRSYASFEEGIERRYEESRLQRTPRELLVEELRDHLVPDGDALWRYRYTQSAVVTAYSELTREPPPFRSVRVPTLLVLGKDSYLPYEHLLDAHREALGDLLEVVEVPGGHTVLWDALDETAAAISGFLGP